MELRRLACATIMLTLVSASLISCGREADEADAVSPAFPQRARVAEALGYTVAEPITGLGLTVFPLTAQANLNETLYRTLQQAQESQKVEARELSEAIVSKVRVVNQGEKPLFLLAGEVLRGGKQDRVVAYDAVVEAEATSEIAVMCIEQSRWAGRSLLKPAPGVAGPDVRMICQSSEAGGQEAMWDAVEDACAGLDGDSDMDSYVAAVEARGADEEALVALCDSIAGIENVRGIAVARGAQLLGIEAFTNPELFVAVLPRLLQSYASDSAEGAGSAPTKREIAQALALADDGEMLGQRDVTGLSVTESKGSDSGARAFAYGVPMEDGTLIAASALHVLVLPGE